MDERVTVLADELADELAGELARAHRTLVPVAPLSQRYPDLDLDGAYRVQEALLDLWAADGRRVVGRKVGLTAQVMRDQLGVDQPDSGVMHADARVADGTSVAAARFISPRVEPEIAFVLGADLAGPGVTAADALAAVAQVRPSLEIIDSRIEDWRITIVDTVADNASFGAFVLGEALPGPLPDAAALAAVDCTLDLDGAQVAAGRSDAVLGSPLNALAWLANALGERGQRLEAGQVVLPGSITAAAPVAAGTAVTATFAGVGSVSVRFT